jgi:hypothetical protein
LVCQPSTVTTIAPELAPTGIGNDTLVLLQAEGVTAIPLRLTVESVPCVSPKLVPVTVTVPFIGALAGETAVMTGMTRKDFVLLAAPPTVTITSAKPGKRLLGTGATILVSLQEVATDVTPPTVIVLSDCVVPKPEPLIVRAEPTGLTGPALGEMLEMAGAAKAKVLKKTLNKNRITERSRTLATMVVSHLDANFVHDEPCGASTPSTDVLLFQQ